MLYLIEGAKALKPELLKKHNLDSLILQGMTRECHAGPDGRGGLLVADSSSTDSLTYEPDRQTWSPRFGSPGVHVGIWNDSRPGPEQLARSEQLPGKMVKLSDGNLWKVPLLREWREEQGSLTFQEKLPKILAQDPVTGRMVPSRIAPRYESLWKQAFQIGESFLAQIGAGDATEVVIDDQLDSFVGALLHINYRIQLPECSILGLLGEHEYSDVMLAALDWERLRALVKNLRSRQSAGAMTTTNTSSGETQPTEGESTTTDQPLAKS